MQDTLVSQCSAVSIAVALARRAALVLALLVTQPTWANPGMESVRALRLQGDLAAAQRLAESTLRDTNLSPSSIVLAHLELARIEDRRGLHYRKRPVPAAWAHLQAATVALPDGNQDLAAQLMMGKADYYYRAEMVERQFAQTSVFAQRAADAFEALGDWHGQADAVHKQGLIALQQRELVVAQRLFDQSLALDERAGQRDFLVAEYERHTAFVKLFSGDRQAAIPHLVRSLALRRRVGAIDPSLFAALTLAGTLLDVGEPERAQAPLLYAQTVASKLDSPFARANLGWQLGRYYHATQQWDAARIAWEGAIKAGQEIAFQSLLERTRAQLALLPAGPVD